MTTLATDDYAALAMDAYERGYNAGEPGMDSFTDIDGSTLYLTSDDPSWSEASASVSDGFYAVAYKFDDQIVVSFRGTDDWSTDTDPWIKSSEI